MWDNLLSIFLLNVGFLLVLAGDFYVLSVMKHPVLFLVVALFAFLALCLYTGVVAMMMRDIANYKALEFTGSAVKEMSVDGRMCMCNMAIEAGAKNGIINPDKKTVE